MPVDLSVLNAADRADFERRLARYGLNASAIEAENLEVTPNRKVLLSGSSRHTSTLKPRFLETDDIATVKKWIGVPDSVFDRAPRIRRPAILTHWIPPGLSHEVTPGRANEALARFDRKKLQSAQLEVMKSAARTFVRGHSGDAIRYKGLIDKFIGKVKIPIWPLLTIRVKSGSVLEFGPGNNLVVLYKLEIEQGGIIRAHGNLNVDCVILKRV